MLFNSAEFLYGFLPAAWAGFFLFGRLSARFAVAWLVLASFVFYAQWSPKDVLVLVVSAAINYTAGRAIYHFRTRGNIGASRTALAAAIAADLALLGYFKYANFLIGVLNDLTAGAIHPLGIVLPLGISFFTFTQIAFLVDVHRGEPRKYDLVSYLLFLTFFPHLIAGPIFHHSEMMPQFSDPRLASFKLDRIVVGLTILSVGLFKKVVIADGLAVYASAVFDAPHDVKLSLCEAWGGTLAYTFQIYFDFSGYSDMAVGLANLFGVRLPVNFWSPYKAASIIEFWRRWHITLSRFLRDYLYIPLGGNRRGSARRFVNLMATMLLGGLWHGAGWTFVVWGGLHGLYLVVNHQWAQRTPRAWTDSRIYGAASWALTFLAVAIAWVFFRADTLGSALDILAAMGGANGFIHPGEANQLFWNKLVPAGWRYGTLFIAGSLSTCLLLPNVYEFMRHWSPALNARETRARPTWTPGLAYGLATAAMMLYAVMLIFQGQPSAFLYFQF